MRIRPLTIDDFSSLLDYDWTPLVGERDTIYLFLARDHGRCCLVAESDEGSPIGFLVGARSADGASLFLFHVHVREEFRGRGIGSQLVQRMEQTARDQGVRSVWLLAREAAAPFYARMGYRNDPSVIPSAIAEYVRRRKSAAAMVKVLTASGMHDGA